MARGHEYSPIPPVPGRFGTERLHLEVPYEVKKNLAFLVDDVLENNNPVLNRLAGPLINPLRETNFRINRSTLAKLRNLLGDEVVDPLEKTIVENRFRCLFSVSTKLAGITGSTAVFTSQDPSLVGIAASLITAAIGSSWEGDDRRQAFGEVQEAVDPVVRTLVHEYESDLYDLDEEDKKTLVKDIIEAVARGESIARPQLAVITAGLLNILTLTVTDKGVLAIGTGIGEQAIVGELTVLLQQAEAGRMSQLRTMGASATYSRSDYIHGSDLRGEFIYRESDQKALKERMWDRAKLVFRHSAIPAGVPLLALIYKLGPLAATLAGQLASQWQSGFGNRIYYAQARAGLNTLSQVFKEIEVNNISLASERRYANYCRAFVEQRDEEETLAVETQLETRFSDAVAYISPFKKEFGGKITPTMHMAEPLVLRPGIHILSAASGKGESIFLNIIRFKMRKSEEKKESFIQVMGEDGQFHWRRVHDLESDQIKKSFVSTTPEPEKMNILPAVSFFGDDLKVLVPHDAPTNMYVDNLLHRFHAGEELDQAEKHAITVCLEHMAGTKPLAVHQIAALKISSRERWIIRQLLPSFGPSLATDTLINHLRNYKVMLRGKEVSLFTDTIFRRDGEEVQVISGDFDSIGSASTWAKLDRATRVKLRIIKALENAQKQGAKVITIDETLDPLGKNPDAFLEYLSKWSLDNKVAILIATEKSKILHQFIDLSPKRSFRRAAFRQQIFFDKTIHAEENK